MSCKITGIIPRGKQASGTTEQSCQAGGSIALMNRYFGVGSRETCARRRLLGVSVPNGRTPIPDEETDAAIWHQWQKYRVENIDSPEALDAMMQVTENLSSCTAPR